VEPKEGDTLDDMSRRDTLLASPYQSTPSRSAPPTRHRALRTLSVAATAAVFSVITIGALVRATGSGLGCPGWPKCFGRWFPPLEHHAIIEYSHRLATTILIALIGLLAIHALRRYRGTRGVWVRAVAAFLLVFVQAALGAIVVHGELRAALVTAHLATAMVLAAVLVSVTVTAYTVDGRRHPADRVARLGALAAGAVFALLVVGAYVRGEGAGLAFRDWPLMAGRVLPPLSSAGRALQFVHRLLAIAAIPLLAVFARAAWSGARADRPAVSILATIACGLLGAQVLVGAANVWTKLATPAVVAHVALAGLLWGTTLAAVLTSRVSVGDRLAPGKATG